MWHNNKREDLTVLAFLNWRRARMTACLIAIMTLVRPAQSQETKPAEPIVAAANRAVQSQLPFGDRQDFEDAMRGFIATTPDPANPDRYAFLKREAPPPVNPSLWRQAQLGTTDGLFKVADGVYQIRGFSDANMTIVEGATGLIVIDTLTTPGAANEALNLYYAHRPRKPVVAVIYSHSHGDHFGGAKGPAAGTVPTTADNFNRAETDMNFGTIVKGGGIGNLSHRRELYLADSPVVRPNRDTLYSMAVFDFDAGPVTITLPDAGDRFLSMQVIDEDQYTHAVYYGAGRYTVTREEMGTRYGLVAIRILVDPQDPKDMKMVHGLQDAIKVEQKNSGKYEVSDFDPVSQKKVRDALLILGATIPDTKRMFGSRSEVDPVRHLIGSAVLWGGLPEKDALYLNRTPNSTDGAAVYKLNVQDVPVDGFWSITVYNAKGYLEPNQYNAYSVNNITAEKNADGSVAVQFGGCDGKIPNCLPTMPGWNYMVRLYRPRVEALNGTWKFREAQLVN